MTRVWAAFWVTAAVFGQAAHSPYTPHEVQGKQLTATLGANAFAVVPGRHVTLTLDIDMNPDMHVYAPGVEGYIPIEWKMQQTSAAEVQPAHFPHAEKLYLKAIDETVPAYTGHFQLTRDVVIRPGAGRITLEGSLRYQACDQRVCYIPQTLPLIWTFEYRADERRR